MDRFNVDQIDRELGRWLRDESAMRAPAGLTEAVFARVPDGTEADIDDIGFFTPSMAPVS